MAEADDMVAEGSPVMPELEVEAADADPGEPEPQWPPYPGPDAFYSGSNLGGHLAALRELLGIEVPDGAEKAGLRGWDLAAFGEALGCEFAITAVTEDQWQRLWLS